MRAAVLTVSDGVSSGTREDKSGDALEQLLREGGFEVLRTVVPDERELIAAAIVELARRTIETHELAERITALERETSYG